MHTYKHTLILHAAHTQHNTSHATTCKHARTHTSIPYHAQVLCDGMSTLLALSRSAQSYTVGDINRERVPPFSSHTVDHHRQKETWEYVSTVEERAAAEEPWLPQRNGCKYVCDRGYVRTYVHTFAVRCLDLRTYVHTLYSSCCRTMRTYVPWGVLYTRMVSHIRTYISKVFHQTGT